MAASFWKNTVISWSLPSYDKAFTKSTSWSLQSEKLQGRRKMLFCGPGRTASDHLLKQRGSSGSSLEKMLNAAFSWLKRDLELSPAASFLGCEGKQGFVHNLKANRIVSKISDSTTNYFSRLEWPMRVRFLASSSRHTDNITKYYLMQVGITHWTLLIHTSKEADKNNNKKTSSIGVEAEQYMNLNSSFKLSAWYVKYIVFLLHYFRCKPIINEDYELVWKKMLLNLMQFDSNWFLL